MAAHLRSADVWDEQHKPDKAAHEREMAQQQRKGAEVDRQRAEHEGRTSAPQSPEE
jgi:hypothetical protein